MEAERTETARLSLKAGKKATSIWDMNKAELVELARVELNMTVAKANAETVTTLREKIRARRAITTVLDDPLATLPVGLSKMKKEELIQEAEQRGLGLPSKPTVGQLQVLIREDVEFRSSISTTEANPNTRSRDPDQMDEEDWESVSPVRPKRGGRS